MARPTKTCDRCGKEFLIEDAIEWQVKYDLNLIYFTEWIRGSTGGASCTNFTLCPDCQNELIAWMEKGVNNGKA